jgi:hypothetical protein
MLNQDERLLIQFVQDAAPSLPVEQRISIYRGAADVLHKIGEKTMRDVFSGKAAIWDDANRRCRELDLKFGGAQ